jgi:hypothetical protein
MRLEKPRHPVTAGVAQLRPLPAQRPLVSSIGLNFAALHWVSICVKYENNFEWDVKLYLSKQKSTT